MKVISLLSSLVLILIVFSFAAFAQTTFTNSSQITINDAAVATPYPANITVSGLNGTVTDIKVRLNGLSHTYLSDVALLLVAPDTNRRFILMSDCGDNVVVSNITVTFDDQATSLVPCDTTNFPSGTYKPTSRVFVDSTGASDPTDPFPAPAPQPATSYSEPAPTGTATLNGTFGGTNPNGVWSLYVIDYFNGDSGSISGGYSLIITTNGGSTPTPTPATPTPTPATPTPTPATPTPTPATPTPTPATPTPTPATPTPTPATPTPTPATPTPTPATPTPTPATPTPTPATPTPTPATPTPTPATPTPTPATPTPTPATPTPTPTPTVTPTPRRAILDFDGDGKSDYAVTRPTSSGANTINWFIRKSSNASFYGVQFGLTDDVKTPGDYDGDGKTDISVWRPSNGVFYVLRSADNSFLAVQFGQTGDEPVARDYNGDGKTDFAVVRRTGGAMIWYILTSNSFTFSGTQFGLSTDVVAPGDYDGDGKYDLAVYRGSGADRTGQANFFVQRSTAGFQSVQFGLGSDLVVPGDYDGDGKTDFAVVRAGSPYNWYILNSSNFSFRAVQLGTKPFFSTQADYDGDGKTDISVWSPVNGVFTTLQSSTGTTTQVQFGQNGDYPIANYDTH